MQPSSPIQQQGAALIIGLIFLIILSVIGLSSMSNVMVQERISGNSLAGYRALQNAEISLLEAEGVVSNGNFEADNDYINDENNGVDYVNAALWINCDNAALADDNLCENLASGSSAKYETTTDEDKYVITVRAVGNNKAVAMVQSVYEGKFELQD
jgi:Tfp pilus assembly protein PilX